MKNFIVGFRCEKFHCETDSRQRTVDTHKQTDNQIKKLIKILTQVLSGITYEDKHRCEELNREAQM